MGTWGLLACGFFIGLCVGQATLVLFLGAFRKDRAETITGPLNLSVPEHRLS
jgi:hypothetical protein